MIKAEVLGDDYRIVVDFRNLIVHEYFGIDIDEIWEILHNELPAFKERVFQIAKKLDRETILKVIKHARNEALTN